MEVKYREQFEREAVERWYNDMISSLCENYFTAVAAHDEEGGVERFRNGLRLAREILDKVEYELKEQA